ncbi:hypothetical protein EDC01DRAFT_632063 [Geopyxis carbonaria]|nr:hypothetical protein EDC01DRAFT_632063 [Geopyxis carbonaria]
MNDSAFIALQTLLYALTTALFVTRLAIDGRRAHLRRPAVASLLLATVCWLAYSGAYGNTIWRAVVRLRRMSATPYENVTPGELKSILVTMLMGVVCLWAAKGSLCALYFLLTENVSKTTHRVLWGAMAYVGLSFAAVMVEYGVWCKPYSRHWAPKTRAEICNESIHMPSLYTYTALNLSSDICVMLVPLLLLRRIALQPRQRFAVSFLFMLGIATMAMGAARFVVLWDMARKFDFGRNRTQVAEFVTKAEMAGAVVAACAPSLRGMVTRRWGVKVGSSGSAGMVGTVGSPEPRGVVDNGWGGIDETVAGGDRERRWEYSIEEERRNVGDR